MWVGGEVCRRSHCVLWHGSRPWDGVKGRCGAGEGRWHTGEPQAAGGGMQRGHPVPLCSLLSQAGWGWMPWGSEEMGSPARGCYGSISPALGCLQRGLLSLSPLPPCPCRLRTPGSGSRQLSVCVARLLACSQGHPCRQHPPDHGWVVPPLLPFVHHLSSHALSFSSLSQARGVNPLAWQPCVEE